MTLQELLEVAVRANASDLHLKVGSPPMMRVSGELQPIAGCERLGREETEAFAQTILTPNLRDSFDQIGEVDLAYSISGLGRFRCSIFQQRGTIGIVLRLLPLGMKTIDDLGLPQAVKRVAQETRGLILVTGTTGSGKTTTLAAIVDYINHNRSAHIVTIEEPIEYLHRDHRSIVNQREVRVDTPSFAHALRSALRQDPDVILVGEMRDRETIETGLIAAETGHLVLSTLHTVDATETINRMVAVFAPHQQHQIRIQLSGLLKAVISQRLLPRADGHGRAVASEIMVSTPFIRECITDAARTHQIRNAIASGTSQYGMQTFDQSIFRLYRSGLVTYEEAMRWASNPDEFRLKVEGVSSVTETARSEMADTLDGEPPDIIHFGR